MSHVVKIRTEVRDAAAALAACRRLGLDQPINGTEHFYSSSAKGLVVHLPDWRYGVVFDLSTGTVHHDNFDGRWGDPVELNRFLQRYALEKAAIEARKAGHSVTEQKLPNGSIKLIVQL